jgi:hypothetical protein
MAFRPHVEANPHALKGAQENDDDAAAVLVHCVYLLQTVCSHFFHQAS